MSGAEFRARAAKGFAWNHLYRLADYGLWNLFSMLIARKLGPSGVAPFVFYYSLALPLAILGGIGVDGVLLRYIARARTPSIEIDPKDPTTFPVRALVDKLLSFRIFITLILSVILLLVLIVLPAISDSAANTLGLLPTFAPFMVVFLWGQAMTAFASSALIGLLQVRWVFVSSVITRSLLLGTGVALAFLNLLSVDLIIKLHTASVLLGAILLLGGLRRALRGLEPERSNEVADAVPFTVSILQSLQDFITRPKSVRWFLATPIMAYGLATWGSDLLSNVLGRQPDNLMMAAFFGAHSTQIGYYAAGNQIILVVQYIFLFGFSGALVSIFSALSHEDTLESERTGVAGYPRLFRARREIAAFQTVAVLPLCAYVYVFGAQILGFIFGPKYLPAVPIIQWGLLIMAVNLAIVGGGVHSTTLVTIGKERLLFKSRLAWGILNLIVNAFLIYGFGALGALFGTQLCDLGACTTEGYFSKRAVGGSLVIRTAVTVLLIVSASAATARLVVDLLSSSITTLPQIIVGAILTIGLSLLLYILLKVEAAKQIFERLRRLYRPKLT